MQKCLDNIYDLDTPATTTRTITLKVKLKPDDAGRWKTDTAMTVKSWLMKNLPDAAIVIA